MRISAEPTDPGYIPPDEQGNYDIYLDGKIVTMVITADDDAGTITVLEGMRAGEEACVKEYQGKVEIKKREGRGCCN